MPTDAVTILASNQHIMKSSQTDKDYRITVNLPLGFFAEPGAANTVKGDDIKIKQA